MGRVWSGTILCFVGHVSICVDPGDPLIGNLAEDALCRSACGLVVLEAVVHLDVFYVFHYQNGE